MLNDKTVITEPEPAPEENQPLEPNSIEVLRFNMLEYHNEYKRLKKLFENKCTASKPLHVDAIKTMERIVKQFMAAQEKATDCAHKLAPYEAPKLESIDIKAQSEHKFVMLAPEKFTTVEGWAAAHNVQQKIIENQIDQTIDVSPLAPSVHDYDAEEDEIATNQQLNTSKRH